MATRKPLVVVSGFISELPPNDGIEGASVGVLTAGSGLLGGGSLATNQRIDVSLASNPSGIIFVGNSIGSDGVAQRTADTALASGNAALTSAATAQASGNAALAKTLIQTSINLSGGVSGAIPYQSAPSATTFLSPGTSGQVLATQGSNQVPRWITPAGGKLLQVVSGVYNSSTSTTNGFYTATTLKATITPSSTTSRVLVQGNFVLTGNLGAGVLAQAALHRGGTEIIEVYSTYTGNQAGFSYIDQPATSGSTTYEMYFKANPGGGNPATFNGGLGGSPVASIVVSEIGA